MGSSRASHALSIAIPDSFTSNYRGLLQKSLSIGFLARACAIFKVEDIYIYREREEAPNLKSSSLISKLLGYLETPQYLRKHLFKVDPDLKHVGLLPPLRTPHHKLRVSVEELEIGSFREGVVVGREGGFHRVYVGLDEDVLTEAVGRLRGRVTVMVKDKREGRIYGEVVDKGDVVEYWGFRVHTLDSGLSGLLRSTRDRLRVLTSRWGTSISEVLGDLGGRLRSQGKALIVFGGPYRGVYEILKDVGANPEDLGDFIVNTVPKQGTATIRVE
ncbi:MAG: putative RNA uridine N3 methyltransferase, partial [Candidatus Geothermarchaeales archaeon]